MCGIAGYLGPPLEGLSALGDALGRSMRHRGPDEEGQQILDVSRPDRRLMLVHRRLAIIDMSEKARQPMYDQGTGNWIVYNGEIYNFRELRKTLGQPESGWTSQSDTEVLLKGYGLRGRRILDDLCGMFAFAIFDRAADELFLAVDPMGIKPLYYHSDSDGRFLFASELRSLLGTGLVPRRMDPVGLESYLSYGAVQAPNTIIAGVSSLLPGTYLRVRAGGELDGPHPYWHAPYARMDSAAQQPAIDGPALRNLLERVAGQHLISDVPTGVLLSGGIDSSAVLALASQQESSLRTFSVTFQEREFSEAPYSRAMARQCQTNHEEICVSEQGLLQMLPDAVEALDQPSVDGTNVFVIASAVRRAGVTVVLSGQGGDELFAGYPTFRRVAAAQAWRKRLPMPSWMMRALTRPLETQKRSSRVSKLGQCLSSGTDALTTYLLLRQLYLPHVRRALFPAGGDGMVHGLPHGLHESLHADVDGLDPVNQVSLLESRTFLANMLLRDGDVMSMARSLELRVPFLDRRVVEAVAAVPGDLKLDRHLPKPLLLKALEGLIPTEIFARPKQGFTFPWERWLRVHLRPFADEAFRNESRFANLGLDPSVAAQIWKTFLDRQAGITWSRVWALVVLSEWSERNRVTI